MGDEAGVFFDSLEPNGAVPVEDRVEPDQKVVAAVGHAHPQQVVERGGGGEEAGIGMPAVFQGRGKSGFDLHLVDQTPEQVCGAQTQADQIECPAPGGGAPDKKRGEQSRSHRRGIEWIDDEDGGDSHGVGAERTEELGAVHGEAVEQGMGDETQESQKAPLSPGCPAAAVNREKEPARARPGQHRKEDGVGYAAVDAQLHRLGHEG